MSLVINRDDIKKGTQDPNNLYNADYAGQLYINTNDNQVYISTSASADGWKKIFLKGDSITVEDLGTITDKVVEDALEEILGDGNILGQPALQIGVKGGVVDVNSDMYVKGDMYLWDSSFVNSNDSTRWKFDSNDVELKIGQSINSMSLNATPTYTTNQDVATIKFKLPQKNTNPSYANATFDLAAIDKIKGNHTKTLMRLVKGGQIIKSESYNISNNNTAVGMSFTYNGADYLEITVSKDLYEQVALTMNIPDSQDRVWTQRNWSPSLIIENSDELETMGKDEYRVMLVRKIEQIDAIQDKTEPLVPFNGEFFIFLGENHTVQSQKGIIDGTDGDYFVKNQAYEFFVTEDNKWKPVEMDKVPKKLKSQLSIPEKGEGDNLTLVAPSTEVDVLELRQAIGDENGAQTKEPIIDNLNMINHSGWSSTDLSAWIYSAQSTEYRLSATYQNSKKYTDNQISNLKLIVDQNQSNIQQTVNNTVSDFSKTGGLFNRLNIQSQNTPKTILNPNYNGLNLTMIKNNPDDNLTLNIGAEETLDTIVLNAKEIIFDGALKNSNNQQDMSLPKLKMSLPDANYINTSASPAIDLNNGAIARTNQIIFSGLTNSPMGLFFPRNGSSEESGRYAGNYDYLNIRNGILRTSAVISSDRNYIMLDGKRIFFSETAPTLANSGDIWIQL